MTPSPSPSTPQTPTATTQPPKESASPDATFEFKPPTGGKLRCTVDGKETVDCTDGLKLTELTEGVHSLVVVAVDAAGNVSAAQTYRWTVLPAPKLTARVARKGVIAKNRMAVVCKLDRDSIKVCAVQAKARVGKKVIVVASGKTAVKKTGLRTVGVTVKFNKQGKKLLKKNRGKKFKLSVMARAQPFTAPKVSVGVKAKVLAAKKR